MVREQECTFMGQGGGWRFVVLFACSIPKAMLEAYYSRL